MAAMPSGAIRASSRSGELRNHLQFRQAVAVLLLAAGLFVLHGLDWSLYRETWQARSWETAEAQIIAVSLDEATFLSDGEGPMRGIAVEYRYVVDGIAFTGHAATLRDWETLDARRLRTLYRDLSFARLTGHAVPVHFEPGEPAIAVLDRSLPTAPSGIALAIAAWCLVVGSLGLRRRDRR